MVNSLVDNPCMTLPVSENWIADFNNLRCQRNYTFNSNFYCQNDPIGMQYPINEGYTYTYYSVCYIDTSYQGEGYPLHYLWTVASKNKTEYKAFSSF